MSTSISDGVTTITPTAVAGYEAARQSRNKLHEPIDNPSPYVSLMVARSRAGDLVLVFDTAPAAHECMRVHADAASLTLTVPAYPALSMVYVTTEDDITIAVDDTRTHWTVTVPFREVLP